MASRDRELCRSIIAKEDIHSYWLNQILNYYPPYLERLKHLVAWDGTEKDLLKQGRDCVKADFVFSSFYGSTAKNCAERTHLPESIAWDVLADFWDRYDGAARWLKEQRNHYRSTGSTTNLCGVTRYGIMSGNEPINTPIQSTAARLVMECQNELASLAKKEKDPHFLPRINIHDDLMFALPDDNDVMLAYMEIISHILVKVRFRWQIVPLMTEWRVGENWADLYPVYDFTGDYNA
jgi:DNA polymerase I-like protein with 3'-5' exonuclease and polymerase domains